MAEGNQIRKKQCSFGHYYDAALFPQCPHCGSTRYTPVITDEEMSVVARLASVYVHGEAPEKTPLESVSISVSLSRRRRENYFVTGWLVVIGGPETGRCFNLYHGENTLGKGERNTVCLKADPAIVKEVHCSIEYEESNAAFYLVPEENGEVYMNDALLDAPVTLKTGSRFRVGNSRMEFVAFCAGEHKWNRKG